jgi:protein gp37
VGENSGIEWTDHTHNPWRGCQAVSPACDGCYAKKLVEGRLGGVFETRERHSAQTRNLPFAWDRKAHRAGRRDRVFSLSLGDIWDNQVPLEWLVDHLDVMRQTGNLDWLLLTKRPQLIARRLVEAKGEARRGGRQALSAWLQAWQDGAPPANVWLGVTAKNQEEADRRIPLLLSVPAKIRFVSCEPLLGPLDLRRYLIGHEEAGMVGNCIGWTPPIDWVIAGGESGAKARPTHPAWLWSLRDQCAADDVPFFFKQWGEWLWTPGRGDVVMHADGTIRPGKTRAFQIDAGRRDDSGWHGMTRVGKRAAGALLPERDWRIAREHRAIPAPSASAIRQETAAHA